MAQKLDHQNFELVMYGVWQMAHLGYKVIPYKKYK